MPGIQFLDSASIAWVRYSTDSHELYVCFRDSGDIYLYAQVPPEAYSKLLLAVSSDVYLDQEIMGKYAYRKIGRVVANS
jgi:hypothetical protein